MKILVFGSTGAVGTAMMEACTEKNIDCVGLNHRDVEITDAGSVEKMIGKYRPDVVLNAVALVGINPCEEHPEKAYEVNATAVYALSKICEQYGIILIQPSSHAVFDGRKDDYYYESDEPAVKNIYGASKYLSERFASDICSKHYIVRFPTLFGPRRNKALGFADKVIIKLQNGEELKIADDKIDSPTYSRDAVEAVISLVASGKPYGIYHIANLGKVSYYDFALKIKQLLKSESKIARAKDKEFKALGFKPLKTALKSEKLQSLRGWEEALTEYMENIKAAAK